MLLLPLLATLPLALAHVPGMPHTVLACAVMSTVSDKAASPALNQLAKGSHDAANACGNEWRDETHKDARVEFTVSGGSIVRARSVVGFTDVHDGAFRWNPDPAARVRCFEDIVQGWDVSQVPDVSGVLNIVHYSLDGSGNEQCLPFEQWTGLEGDVYELLLQREPSVDPGPPPPPPPRPRIAKVSVGTLQAPAERQREFEKVLRKYRGQLKYCYELRLKHDPSVEGALRISAIVDGGRIGSVETLDSSTGDADLDQCVRHRVRRWRFPGDLSGAFVLPVTFQSEPAPALPRRESAADSPGL